MFKLLKKIRNFFNLRGFLRESDGFSMFITLLFVAGIGIIIASVAFYGRDFQLRNQGYAAGWHLTQISKAARVYVRDNSLNPAHPTSFANLNVSGSVEIPIADLIDNGYLPAGFSATNPLRQTVRIFASFYPVVPAGLADPTVNIPTAYVVTDDDGPPRADSNAAMALMEGARASGLSASAPLFVDGTNLSEDCNGSPAVMIWDTGCLNAANIATVTGGAVTIAEGQVMVPAWRSVQHDARALMRYLQPENPGSNAMATNMFFGTPQAGAGCGPNNEFVCNIVTNQPHIRSDLPRSSILNVGSLDMSTLVATDNFNDENGNMLVMPPGHSGDQVFTAATMAALALNTDYSLDRHHQQVARFGAINVATGLVTIDQSGPLQDSLRMLPGTMLRVEGADGVTAQTLNVTGTATAQDTNTDIANITTLSGFDTLSVTQATMGAGATLNVTNELVAKDIMGAGTINTTGETNILGELNTGALTATGGTVGSPAASLRTGNLTVVNNLTAVGAISFSGNLDRVRGNATVSNFIIRQRCFGDCPPTPPPEIVIP